MTHYYSREESPYLPNSSNVDNLYSGPSEVNEHKIIRGLEGRCGMQKSSDDEESYETVSSNPKDSPTDQTYEHRRRKYPGAYVHPAWQALDLGLNAAEDAAAAAASAAGTAYRGLRETTQCLIGNARRLWEAGTEDSSSPPASRKARPAVRRYKTAQGIFFEVRGHQESQHEKVLYEKPTEPQTITGISGPYGTVKSITPMRSYTESEHGGRNKRLHGSLHRHRAALPGLSGLIEVNDNEDDDDYEEARDRDFLAVDTQRTSYLMIRDAAKTSNLAKRSYPTLEPEKDADSYSEPEGEDSDFGHDGGVPWPFERDIKRSHMAKMATKRRVEAAELKRKREEQEIRDSARKQREDERERKAKSLLRNLRRKAEKREQCAATAEAEEGERVRRDLEEWPDAYNAFTSRLGQLSDHNGPVTEESKYSNYLREKEEVRFLEVKRQELRLQSKSRNRKEDAYALQDPMAHLGLSSETRHMAQALFSKDRQARKEANGDLVKKIKPIAEAFLKK